MSFADAIRILNRLKRRKIIRDCGLIGAVAATAYMEPMFTEDLDIIVLVDTDEEYLKTFRHVAELAEDHEGMHHVLGGVPVKMFPTTTKDHFRIRRLLVEADANRLRRLLARFDDEKSTLAHRLQTLH